VKIIPLAAESLGVRSMATFVEVGHTGILIDPGATLAAARFGLPPADEEWDALRRANDRISGYAARAEIVFVSHYHEDHFRTDPVSYAGRTVLVKDPRRMVHGQQARRGLELWKALDGLARIRAADGLERREAEFSLEVSAPLPHGMDGTPLGSVVALTIADPAERERFVFASDVQGPLSPVAAAYLTRQRPTLVYLSGPPSYIEREVGAASIERGVEHLLRLVEATGCRVILDHHALRDMRWQERFDRLWQTGRVTTAAGFLGLAASPLECHRPALWARARKPAARVPSASAMIEREAPTRRAARSGSRRYAE
jgi:predicted metallo-beta-lactamase superfamily hydrolase